MTIRNINIGYGQYFSTSRVNGTPDFESMRNTDQTFGFRDTWAREIQIRLLDLETRGQVSTCSSGKQKSDFRTSRYCDSYLDVRVYLITASDHIGPYRTTSDHVCKREIVTSKAKPKSAGISFRANKPPGAQLAHYKLGSHKSNIKPKSSVVCMSPTVSIQYSSQ